MKAVIIDTETTGFAKPIFPVQVCMMELLGEDPRKFTIGDVWFKKFNPGKPMEFGAQSTHLISDKMAAEYPPWDKDLIPDADMYIGHDVDYDWEVVGSPEIPYRVCTLAMARRAWPDVDTHKLGALLVYLLGAEKAFPLLQGAHDAGVDARNTQHLLRAVAVDWNITTWQELWETSEECRMPQTMTFGKHGPNKETDYKGMPIDSMVKEDWSYCRWLLDLEDLDPYLRKAIMRAHG